MTSEPLPGPAHQPPPIPDTYMGVAGDHIWLCRAISTQKPTFRCPRSGPTTCLPEGALEAVTWLVGRGGCRRAPGELVQLVWARRQEAQASTRLEGGWGLAGSSGEVLSAVLINYLPATGLLAALGCLAANTLSHAWCSVWARMGSH